jgi:hypothetical protein
MLHELKYIQRYTLIGIVDYLQAISVLVERLNFSELQSIVMNRFI